MYKRSSITITAQSSFHAQREAARIFKAKKPWDVTVTLHCKDGTPVPFDPAGL
jgi:phosphotransferase system HPr-like phosphotransfer protein